MLRFIVQTKRNYISKQEAADKTAEVTKKYEDEEKSARLTKKLKRSQIRTLTKLKTVMCPSKKILTKQLIPLKKKKTRSNTSRELQKKPKNT